MKSAGPRFRDCVDLSALSTPLDATFVIAQDERQESLGPLETDVDAAGPLIAPSFVPLTQKEE